MIDKIEGGGPDPVDGEAAEAKAEMTPEEMKGVERLRNMSWEELQEIGRQYDRERRFKAMFSEIP